MASGVKLIGNVRVAWFEFKTSHLGETIRVEWPQGAPVIVLDAEVARALMAARYAYNIDDDKMASFNAAVDAYLAPVDVPVAPAAVPNDVPDAPPAPPAPSDTGGVPDAPAIPDAEAKGKKGK